MSSLITFKAFYSATGFLFVKSVIRLYDLLFYNINTVLYNYLLISFISLVSLSGLHLSDSKSFVSFIFLLSISPINLILKFVKDVSWLHSKALTDESYTSGKLFKTLAVYILSENFSPTSSSLIAKLSIFSTNSEIPSIFALEWIKPVL